MRVELESEAQTEQVTAVFNLRRHKQSSQPSNQHKIYLTAKIKGATNELFPVVIDGQDNTIRIRKHDLELLGFQVIINFD